MNVIKQSFSVFTTIATIMQAIIIGGFLTVILTVDAIGSIPAKWLFD